MCLDPEPKTASGPWKSYLLADMMQGFCLLSGQLVTGKLVSVSSFSNFRWYLLSLPFMLNVLLF